MATIQTLYLGDLRTEITHVQSGNRVITDAPTDNNGKGEYISPTDMVAAALGSCMLTLMGIAARRLEIDLKGTRVEIQKVGLISGFSVEPCSESSENSRNRAGRSFPPDPKLNISLLITK